MDPGRTRLKRERMKQAAPFPSPAPQVGGRIELAKPTPEDPALRRYVADASLDVAARFADLGILDWRFTPPAGQVGEGTVADRIICGDSRTCLQRLPAESAACIITSPPYWNVVDYGFAGQLGPGRYDQYLRALLGVWAECERVLIPNGKLCINAPIMPIPKSVMPDQHTRHLKNLSNDIEAGILRELALERFSLYVWQKQTTEKMFGSYPHPPNILEQNTIEFINVFVKPGKPRRMPGAVKERSRLSEQEWMNLTRQVWRLYPQDVKRSGHPAPFPQSLPNRLIAMYTFAACDEPGAGYPGDLVLDPFCGTGATCAAARALGRRYVGIDLGPDFVAEAARRCAETTSDGRIHLCE